MEISDADPSQRDAARTRKRNRLHQRQRRRRRAYAVLGDKTLAAKRADHLSRCPRWCRYCANPRRVRAGQGRAKLTLAERRVYDSFKEQMREHALHKALDVPIAMPGGNWWRAGKVRP